MNIFSHFTTYNIVGTGLVLGIGDYLPWWFNDAIRSTSIMIMVAFTVVFLVLGNAPVLDMYQKNGSYPWPAAVLIVHFVQHFMPALLLGLPQNFSPWPIIGGFAAILVWYLAIRHHIGEIYSDTVSQQMYDLLVFGVVGSTAAFLLWRTKESETDLRAMYKPTQSI